jgi:PAS domain S-box-containing protein
LKKSEDADNTLRRKAEEKSWSRLDPPEEISADEARRLIHELQIHQIELEMQNEELRASRMEIERAGARYADLYDFAPVGYLSLNRDGLIVEANLTAANQFGKERSLLLRTPFHLCVVEQDRDAFHLHKEEVFRTGEPQSCEVRLKSARGDDFHARLESMFIEVASGGGLARTSISDITCSKRIEEMRRQTDVPQAITALLGLLNEVSSRKEYLDAAVREIKGQIGCRCVGIRMLDQKVMVPYEAHTGFSREFCADEDWVSQVRDCRVCSRVLGEQTEPSDAPYLTRAGSYFCNNTAELSARLSDEQIVRFRDSCLRHGFRSIAVVPARHGGKIVGAIHLADEREGKVPLERVELAESMAELIGAAIYRFSMQDRLRQNHDIQNVVNSLLRLALDDVTLDELLKRALDLLLAIPWLSFESTGSIFLVEPGSEMLILKAQKGLSTAILDRCGRVPFGQCVCGRAALNREIQLIRCPEGHPEGLSHSSPHSHYCVPILLAESTLGLINLYAKLDHNQDQMEVEFLAAVANTLAGIIHRKGIEESLRMSEERFRSMFEKNLAVKLLIDPDTGAILDANPAACRFYGYSVEQLRGMAILDINTLTKESIVEEMTQARTEKRNHFHFEHRLASGETRDVEVHSSPIDFRGKKLLYSIITDITDLKRAQNALRESEQKHRMIFENSPLGIVHFNNAGIVTACNDNLLAIIGSSREKLLGLNLPASLLDERMKAAIADSLAGKPSHYEGSYRSVTSGKVAYIKAEYSPIFSEDGSVMGGVGVVEDITERKKAEEASRESETQLRVLSSQLLKAQEEERKRIAGELHDSIGSLLTAVKFGLESTCKEMLQIRADCEPIEPLIGVVQQAIDESRRIMMDLRPSILDDLGIIATIAWFCRQHHAIHPGIQIERQIDVEEHEIPEFLKIVVFRLMQEALNNICKYSKAELVEMSLEKSSDRIALRIEDYGDGFDVSAILAGRGHRKGLGLTSMKERTELSGGTFEVESVPGEGTVIRASWPCEGERDKDGAGSPTGSPHARV